MNMKVNAAPKVEVADRAKMQKQLDGCQEFIDLLDQECKALEEEIEKDQFSLIAIKHKQRLWEIVNVIRPAKVEYLQQAKKKFNEDWNTLAGR